MQEQFCGRPPGLAGVPQMQEQFCGRPPGMAGVPQMQEQFAAYRVSAWRSVGSSNVPSSVKRRVPNTPPSSLPFTV